MRVNIKTDLGHKVIAKRFSLTKNPLDVIIIASATGVKQNYYSLFAEFLSQKGYEVITFDYYGIGNSKKGEINKLNISATQWGANDLTAIIKYCKIKFPNNKLIVIGHSMGGQLIGLSPLGNQINKIILIASQSGYWRFWKGLGKIQMLFLWYIFIPTLSRIFGFFPGKKLGIMENLPKQMALEWSRWGKSSNYLFDHINETNLSYSRFKGKLISYSIDDDAYAPKSAVDWLTNKYESAQSYRKHIFPKKFSVPKIGHFGIFKPKFKDSIWEMILGDIRKI